MSASQGHPARLVADIGGTNSRLALFDPRAGKLRALRTYKNRDYQQFEDIIENWLHTLAEPAPTDCCLAVAAPPTGDQVTMLNIDWSFSSRELAQRFGFARLRCINDFEGNAHALPHLVAGELVTLHNGSAETAPVKLATMGPGTGLGGSTLVFENGLTIACACEPGHMGLAAGTALELELFRALQPAHGEVHAELLVSGPGISRLYQTLAAVLGQEAQAINQEEISSRALSGECDLCITTLNTFCALLGSACGDFVLANGAYGGLYLAGGIIPEMIPFLQASSFQQRFSNKGNMHPQLAAIPLHVITSGTAGLLGAAHAPL